MDIAQFDDAEIDPGTLLTHQVYNEFNDFATPTNNVTNMNPIIGNDVKFSYANFTNYQEKENCQIFIDHCYARPWNWRPESVFLRPTKTLFMNRQAVQRRSLGEDDIDVESVEEPVMVYDKAKAKYLMEECERHAALARIDEGNENWEETISRTNWTPIQHRLFNSMAEILNSDHMARLAVVGTQNEAIARRTVIDKSVERLRKLFAGIAWDSRYTVWLHQLLFENLSTTYLAAYLDILQTLKSKLPTFVDKLMTGMGANKISVLSYESLFPLFKRTWDPIASSLQQDKPKKLPGNPVIIVIPCTPFLSKRTHKWVALLSNLAVVQVVTPNLNATGHKMTMTNYVDHLCVLTRMKIQDVRNEYPGRNIVLVGFNSGATLALQVAQVEQVLCVICLGFSLLTAEGRRGEPDDNLLELKSPVLFVIGQCSNTSLQEDMEDLREKMRVETGLIIVGSADDYLRVSKKKKRLEGITQSIIDRCIADEVGEFISGIILSPFPPQIRQSPTNLSKDGSTVKKVKERKRYNSTTSSLESEPPSPTPRITRPGQNKSPNLGRPPGSKSKLKETKWANQGIPNSSSPSNSSPFQYTTPDTSSNDSSQTDKTHTNDNPPKKIKTLKPHLDKQKQNNANTQTSKNQNNTIKLHGYNIQHRNLTNLLQDDSSKSPLIGQTTSPHTSTGIKVLENVKLGGKTVDLSKLSVLSPNSKITSTTLSNIIVLPDGKLKTIQSNLKETKYITSKRQLQNKPSKTVKKLTYLPSNQSSQTNKLTPPKNLTTQDIMDLPIIFADDNQVLESDQSFDVKTTTSTTVNQPPAPKIISTAAGNKFVLVNKHLAQTPSGTSSFIISSNIKKTSPLITKTGKPAKIIVSNKTSSEELKVLNTNVSKIGALPSEISIKKIVTPDKQSLLMLDYDNDIKASFIPNKATGETSKGKITLVANKHDILKSEVLARLANKAKRSASEIMNGKHDEPPLKLPKIEETGSG